MDQGVGHEIKRLREERGWSQAKLAVEADMSVSGVSMIENGQRNLTTTTLAKLARAFGIEIGDLFPKVEAPLPFDMPEEDATERRPDESLAAGRSDLEVYVRVANAQVTRWEQEIDARIESAQDNHGAFFVWSAEVIGSILALRNSVIPGGLPFPRDPMSDPIFDDEEQRSAWETDYRERQLFRKIRNAKRQYLPGQDEIDRKLQELLEQPEPAIARSDD